jgi:hypothetical protein
MAEPNPPPAPYVPVEGDDIVQDGINEADTIIQSLYWIGFRSNEQRVNIVEDSLGSFDDIRMLSEKDISAMATEWAGRTVVNGRITFGIRRTKLLKALTHWVKDFFRISSIPHINTLNENGFKSHLQRALARSDIRSNIKDQMKIAATASSPGPLESERQWKQWEEKFNNYARSHLGANGIPLSYVIRKNDEPNLNGEFTDFLTQTIECAPLTGEYYLADRLTVFNMITSFTTGQPSHDWIKSTIRYADGRRSMKALRDHFEGEGNASRNKNEADRLKDTLHYKSERSMTFETFLTQCQKMYNIYEKEGEPMPDDAKTRFLFKKVQHSGLRGAIEALRAQQTAGLNVTYTMAANHISTAVSELPEYLSKNRNVSGVGSHPGSNNNSNNENTDGIYAADGTIRTGHISNWRTLSEEDRNKVKDERKKLGMKRNGNKGANHNAYKSDTNRLKQLSAQNKKMKRQIKALKRNTKKSDVANEDSDGDTDAGDQFGGRASKRKKNDA